MEFGPVLADNNTVNTTVPRWCGDGYTVRGRMPAGAVSADKHSTTVAPCIRAEGTGHHPSGSRHPPVGTSPARHGTWNQGSTEPARTAPTRHCPAYPASVAISARRSLQHM